MRTTPRRSRARRIAGLGMAAGAAVWLRACFASPSPLVASKGLEPPAGALSGVVHVHTNLSDGRGTPGEVIEAARRAGADFLVITDHNRVDGELRDLSAGRAGDPILVPGAEISTEAGHIVAIGLREPSFRFSGTLREVLDDVRHLGGCAFVAHPTSPRGETRFTAEGEPGTWGVEIVNGDTAWREASAPMLAFAAWSYPANPAYALRATLGSFASDIALWDRVLAKRFAPAIGGTDAHGRIPLGRNTSLPIPSYEAMFGLVRTVVYPAEPWPEGAAQKRAAIARALCEGRSSVAIPSFADPRGFSFVARTPNGKTAGPGMTVEAEPGLTIRVGGSVPAGTKLRLLQDGREVASAAEAIEFPVKGPGVFRAEAYLRGESTPWMLANPISVLSVDQVRDRETAARAEPAAAVEGSVAIDPFEGMTHFAAEHDPGSTIDEPVLDPNGGRGRGAAARLSFHLNPTPKPPVWCALVDRTARNLQAQKGVSFWLRADGEYRIWFQIRDLNPASADEGTEAWFASVRTSPAWTLYNIPFSSLRSINKASDGAFDPAKIAHIVFVIDHGAMPFGSAGTIWIDDLRAY